VYNPGAFPGIANSGWQSTSQPASPTIKLYSTKNCTYKEISMRVILADSHPQILSALKIMLEEKSELELIGEAVDAQALIALVESDPPDLALIDWELPGKSINDLITELHAIESRPIVVVMGSKPEYGRMLLKAGADAFVSKSDQPDWLLETLQRFEQKSNEKRKKSS
jgi:DNA-binding NarL/FixJ family response regulator